MRFLPVLVAVALATAGCEDGPEQIFEPFDGNAEEQNGNDAVPSFVLDEHKGWEAEGGDKEGRARFCDEAENTGIYQWMVEQPIIPDTGMGGVNLWLADGTPAIADDLLGRPADFSDPGADQSFCDPSANYYINAMIFGPNWEVIVVFDTDTRLLTFMVALPGYLGALEGTAKIGPNPEDTETVRILPREKIVFNKDGDNEHELDVYNPNSADSWLNGDNVNRIWRAIRQSPPFNDDPSTLTGDCIDRHICDVIFTEADESIPQETVILMNDVGLQLPFAPDGTLDSLYVLPVRLLQFELDGEVSFDGTVFGDAGSNLGMVYRSRSLPTCTFNLEEELTWGGVGGFKERCGIDGNAEYRLDYAVWDMRDMVDVNFQTLSFTFQRDVTANPVYLDGEHPADDDILSAVWFPREAAIEVEEFVPSQLAVPYLNKLEAHLVDAVCVPGECPTGLNPAGHDFLDPVGNGIIPAAPDATLGDEPQRVGELYYDRIATQSRLTVDEGTAAIDDTFVAILDVAEGESVYPGSVNILNDGAFVATDVDGSFTAAGLTGTVDYANGRVELTETGDVWGAGEFLQIDCQTYQERNWIPDVVQDILDTYEALSFADKAMLDPRVGDPVLLTEAMNEAVIETLTHGESIPGPGHDVFSAFFTSTTRRSTNGAVDFEMGANDDFYSFKSYYSMNYGAISALAYERGLTTVDQVFAGLNEACNNDLGANAPYYEVALSRDSSELSFINPYALGGRGIEVLDFDRQYETLDVRLKTVNPDGSAGTSMNLTVNGYPMADQNGFYKQVGGESFEFVPSDLVNLGGRADFYQVWVGAEGRIERVWSAILRTSIELCPGLELRYGDEIMAKILDWEDNVTWSEFLNCELVYNYTENGNILDSVVSIGNKTGIALDGDRVKAANVWR